MKMLLRKRKKGITENLEVELLLACWVIMRRMIIVIRIKMVSMVF